MNVKIRGSFDRSVAASKTAASAATFRNIRLTCFATGVQFRVPAGDRAGMPEAGS
jgi:hypothetical protein